MTHIELTPSSGEHTEWVANRGAWGYDELQGYLNGSHNFFFPQLGILGNTFTAAGYGKNNSDWSQALELSKYMTVASSWCSHHAGKHV